MSRLLDLTGQQFGRLTVQRRSSVNQGSQAAWECVCSCGSNKVTTTSGSNLKRGLVQSCGCLRREKAREHAKTLPSNPNLKHGMRHTRVYNIWLKIKQRCTNPNDEKYPDYGGRGIQVCSHWLESFENFYADMGNPPSNHHSIDRRDTNGNYDKANCRWATNVEQQNNKRTNLLITWSGRTMTAAQWGKEIGIDGRRLADRIRKGWTPERTLTTPTGRSHGV